VEALVIRPIQPNNLQQEPLPEPNSTPQDLDSLLAKRTIYYEYDSYNVKEEYQPLVEAHSKFMLAHKEVKLRIEGNCDERGSREYNLALGQRRADAVKRALTLLGVPAGQIETVSFGSEKPRATSHDEQAYAENRRSDLMYVRDKSASQ
jgi:peptidoglycan-associated lipoprotein